MATPAEPQAAAKAKAKPVNGMAVFDKFKTSPLPSTDVSGAGTPTGHAHVHPVNKHLEAVVRTPGRQPSPQPTHLGIPGGTHRVLSEEGPGYVSAVFEGKEKQMEAGKCSSRDAACFLKRRSRN